MSVKWIAEMWDSDLKGPELLVAIAIADHADANGVCFPGYETIALKVKLKTRQVQALIKRLEQQNVLKVERHHGRGNFTVFKFQKVQDHTPLSVPEKVQKSVKKRCASAPAKGARSRQEKVQNPASPPTPPYKENLKEPSYEPGENHAPPAEFDAESRLRLFEDLGPVELFEAFFQVKAGNNFRMAILGAVKDLPAWRRLLLLKAAWADKPEADRKRIQHWILNAYDQSIQQGGRDNGRPGTHQQSTYTDRRDADAAEKLRIVAEGRRRRGTG
jgi:hypothetical protein